MLSNDHLSLRSVGLKPGEQWVIPRGGLGFLFPTSGAGTCVAGPASQNLGPGGVVVLSSDGGGSVSASERSGLKFSFFSLSFEQLYPLFASHELHLLQSVEDRLKRSRMCLAPPAVATQCHKLLQELPAQFNLEHRGHLLRISATLLSQQFNEARPQTNGYVRMEDHLCQVFEKLSLDELLNLSVGELASRFSCSRRHLNRLFHQYFGMSVATLRMELRLLKAVSLLRNPTAKVINVAEQCGFNHLGLFGTCFKRRFGVSPGQWRKQAMEPAVAHEAHDPLNDTPPCQMADNGLCQWHCQSVNGLPLLPEIQQESSRNSRIDRPYINGNGDKRAELTPRVTLNPSRSGFTIHVHA